ncbi:MAG: hypothetical protein M1429_04340 [Patescibacteria group bacterium]|nr:hypothetical protein [Patescibacteria group bacterium]
MKKFLFLFISGLFIFWIFTVLGNGGNYSKSYINRAQAASTGNVLLTGTVLQYITLAFSSGSTISFGNITPGTPKCGDVTSQADVTTNASGGYNLAVSDSIAGTNSAMVHSDGTTYIPDMNSGTIATPVVWVTGTHLGVGTNMFSGTQKEAAWGTGTTACDVLYDKWAAVPQNATTGHTVTGYHASADSSFWSWRIDVANTQKTGIYSGNVLFTSAAVLT